MRIKRHLLTLALGAIAFTTEVGAQASEPAKKAVLPESAQSVLEKLEQFEAQTMLEAQVKIEGKRREVIRFLEGRLEAETRSGNLDGAIAIRAEVARLKALSPAALPAAAKAVPPVDEEAGLGDEAHPILGRWKFEDQDGSELVREFTPEGKCNQYRSGRKEWTLNYEVVNRREVDVVFLGALKFRHSLRGNGTLKTSEPDAVAEREKPDEKAAE